MEVLSTELKKIHAYLVDTLENKEELESYLKRLFHIFVRSSSKGSDVLGKVDYITLNVTFDEDIDSDIVLDVFVNRLLYDAVKAHMDADDGFFTVEHALTPLIVTSDEDGEIITEKVRVYAFKDEEEMCSTEIEKSLRIKTLYGIGYVGLVPEGHPNATNFKICVGHNKFGTPIIRCLERTHNK